MFFVYAYISKALLPFLDQELILKCDSSRRSDQEPLFCREIILKDVIEMYTHPCSICGLFFTNFLCYGTSTYVVFCYILLLKRLL